MLKVRLKSISIALLFILCVFQLSYLWMDKLSLADYNEAPQDENNIVKLEGLINPQSLIYDLGGTSYHRMIYSDDYGHFEELSKIIANDLMNLIYEARITEDEFLLRKREASITIVLPLSFSVKDYLQIILGDDGKDYSGSDYTFDTMIIDNSNEGIVYLKDSKSKKYYKLRLSNTEYDISGYLSEIENREESIVFRTVKDKFPFEEEYIAKNPKALGNQVIIPRGGVSKYPIIQVTDEYVKGIADKVFGGNMSFVRKMKDSDDSTIYLYGYGEVALKITNDSIIEYNKTLANANPNVYSLIDSIKTAVSFINKVNGDTDELYLSSYEKGLLINKTEGYRLGFDYKINGLTVVHNNDEGSIEPAITMEVYGNEVISYRRNVKELSKIFNSDIAYGNPVNLVDFFKNSLATILEDFEKKQPEYSDITQAIDYFSVVYYYISIEDNQKLYPAMVLGIDGVKYYIDIYSGNIISKELN